MKKLVFSTDEYKRRLNLVKERMDHRGIEMLLVLDPSHMNYLTGFDGWSFYVHQGLVIDLKDPRFVTGYAGQEIDLALMSGEVDARANITDSVVERTPDWIEKGRVHFHALLEIPKGFRLRHPSFDRLPALDTFAKTELQRKVLAMFRNFRLIGSPYILPPSTPKERVEILEEAMRKSFKDPEFTASMRKFTGADASPLMPEEQAMAIKEIPRDPLVIDLYKKLAGSGSLPPR